MKPDPSFRVTAVSVVDRAVNEIAVQQTGSGTFTFVQPGISVYVEAAFVKDAWNCPYVDVTSSHWAYDSIRAVSEAGIMGGTTDDVFNPAGTVTRQQMWMVLARMSGAAPDSMTEARAWAVKNGISDGSNPTAAVTRQQCVTLLFRYAQTFGGLTATAENNLQGYPDAAAVAPYAVPAMNWAVGRGIMGGTAAGTLNPAGTATRAHMAKMLASYLDLWY